MDCKSIATLGMKHVIYILLGSREKALHTYAHDHDVGPQDHTTLQHDLTDLQKWQFGTQSCDFILNFFSATFLSRAIYYLYPFIQQNMLLK